MAYNLFVSYDLDSPGQNYESVRKRIKSLGRWHQFQMSFFYVNTDLNAIQAYAAIAEVIDSNDRLAVIDAAAGIVTAWDRPPIDAINAIWSAP
jgi:hypothetical protein